MLTLLFEFRIFPFQLHAKQNATPCSRNLSRVAQRTRIISPAKRLFNQDQCLLNLCNSARNQSRTGDLHYTPRTEYTRQQKQKRALASASGKQLTGQLQAKDKGARDSSWKLFPLHLYFTPPSSFQLPCQTSSPVHSERQLNPGRGKKFKIHTGVVRDLQRRHDVSQQTRRKPRFPGCTSLSFIFYTAISFVLPVTARFSSDGPTKEELQKKVKSESRSHPVDP